MKNLGQIMKQAQELQTKMQDIQEKLSAVEMTGSAGAGMVTVTMNGKGELRQVKISPELFNDEDVEVVEDLIVAACGDAKAKAEAHMSEEMAKVTGGLQLPPGMKLPF
ncbi:MAG: YbaB/EbfC family nucleoid-associated protein [Pseudomonadota bacterium]|nr:YbaB/EbfC family nucleoid-associated protein [Pseudomonadota bacterium]